MKVSRNELVELYLNQKLSISQIAKKLGYGNTFIQKHLVLHNIPRRGSGEHHIKHINVEEIINLYKTGLSAKAISIRFGVSEPTILDRLKNAGIEVKMHIPKSIINNDDLIKRLYVDENKSAEAIANELNTSGDTIIKKLRKLNIDIRTGGEQLTKPMPNLYELYVNQKKSTKEIAKIYGVHQTSVCSRLRDLEIDIRDEYISSYELDIRKWLDELGIEYECNKRRLIGKELDIIIPNHKLAIEFNGQYWHTDNWVRKNYHIHKSIKCNEVGYHLIHVWEWLWIEKREIYESIIKLLINVCDNRIYARKCTIKSLDYATSSNFLNVNHLQGSQVASKYYGLFYNNELVQLMSFTRKASHWEISRLCSKLNTKIIGGTERLWKHFLDDQNPTKVITYSDASVFRGDVYIKLGMCKAGLTVPDYVWIKGKTVLSRQRCQKRKLIKAGHKGDTENSIMRSLGYTKLYKCGNHKFLWIRA